MVRPTPRRVQTASLIWKDLSSSPFQILCTHQPLPASYGGIGLLPVGRFGDGSGITTAHQPDIRVLGFRLTAQYIVRGELSRSTIVSSALPYHIGASRTLPSVSEPSPSPTCASAHAEADIGTTRMISQTKANNSRATATITLFLSLPRANNFRYRAFSRLWVLQRRLSPLPTLQCPSHRRGMAVVPRCLHQHSS